MRSKELKSEATLLVKRLFLLLLLVPSPIPEYSAKTRIEGLGFKRTDRGPGLAVDSRVSRLNPSGRQRTIQDASDQPSSQA